MPEQMKKVVFWRSLQTKYALTYISIIAAVIVLLNTYPVLLSQDLVYQSKHAALKNQAAVLASTLSVGPEGLTAEETSERDALRREYVDAFKASLTAQLDNTVIQYPDGTRKRLRKRDCES